VTASDAILIYLLIHNAWNLKVMACDVLLDITDTYQFYLYLLLKVLLVTNSLLLIVKALNR
jgi:hypothetical protein